MWSMALSPLIPLTFLVVLALAALLAAGAAIVLAGRTAILRALALVALTVALADPSFVKEDREPVKDVVDQGEGSQSLGQPSSDWKLPGATAITELLLSVTQWRLWS